jgi:hypothetical protein
MLSTRVPAGGWKRVGPWRLWLRLVAARRRCRFCVPLLGVAEERGLFIRVDGGGVRGVLDRGHCAAAQVGLAVAAARG